MILQGRELPLLAVDRPAGRGEDDLTNAMLDAVLKKPDRPDNVDVSIKVRLSDRAPHVHLGRLVQEGVWFELFENLAAPGPNVYLVEWCPFRNVFAPARREVVDDGELMTAPQQLFGRVRTIKPAPPVSKTLILEDSANEFATPRLPSSSAHVDEKQPMAKAS
jgi:hypothetical protein